MYIPEVLAEHGEVNMSGSSANCRVISSLNVEKQEAQRTQVFRIRTRVRPLDTAKNLLADTIHGLLNKPSTKVFSA